jgi:hypothetical protein
MKYNYRRGYYEESPAMPALSNHQEVLTRFVRAITKAFPDANIDEYEEDMTCSYGDIGLWAHSEADRLVIEVSNTFPIVTEEELPDDWYYFKMEFTSEQLDPVIKKTLLQSGHGWEELDCLGMGCPVDWGGASLTLKNNASDQTMEQVVKDLEHYFTEAGKEVNLEKAAQAWFVAKCVKMGLESHFKISRPLLTLKDWQEHLVDNDRNMIGGSRNELLPTKFLTDKWFSLSRDKLAIGENFYFAEVNDSYFAYHHYPISFAYRILSLAVEPMQEISRIHKLIHEINREGTLRIQLKGHCEFNPWFLISPYDLLSAKALEPKEPTISQRTGLLRTVLGESKVPRINFGSMSDDEFEEFCCSLLIARGATEIERRGPSRSRDSGVDISFQFERPEFFGKKTIKILVQCKKIKTSFRKTEYDKLHFHELLRMNNADEFLVMCSSEPTKDVLELAHSTRGRLLIMGNSRLREEAAKYPEILTKNARM